jgi:hypothetical protein
MPGLKDCAQKKFRIHIKQHVEDPDLPEALKQVYTTTMDTDRGLRNIVISTFRSNPALQRRPDIRGAIQETAQLAAELQNMKRGYPIY